MGKSKKIGPITNYYYSDKLLTTKEKNIKDKFYNNPKWSELSQITRETRWNEYAKYLGLYSYEPGFTEEITYGFGWKNPFPELIKREKILKEKYKYKNGKMRKDKDYISWESIQNEKRFVINQTKYGFGKYHEHRREIAEEQPDHPHPGASSGHGRTDRSPRPGPGPGCRETIRPAG